VKRYLLRQHLARVYREGRLVVKWDLDNGKAMKGAASREIRVLIRVLELEGRL
jgi:hypothetical protein